MSKFRQASAATITALLSLGLLLLSAPVSADQNQSLMDKLAIADVVAQYAYTWDTKDAEAYANLFTEDGISEVWLPGKSEPLARRDTRQAILAAAKKAHTTRLAGRQTRHHQSALIFHEISATSALTQNMVLITHQTTEDDAPVLKYSGIYKDEWRKTQHGWFFSRRSLYLDPIIQ
jgi:uncharacterized protein (TIGR02246 family)